MRRWFVTVSILLGTLGGVSCGGGLRGTWNLSGDLDLADYQRFQGRVKFDREVAGYTEIDFGTSAQRRPVCAGRLAEDRLEFTVDGSDRQSMCDGMATPYILKGQLGADVISGEVYDRNLQKVGLWRAFRQAE